MESEKSQAKHGISPVQIINSIAQKVSWIAYLAIAAMMVFVFYDVIARYFRHPTAGSNDIVQTLAMIAIPLAMSYTLVLRRHPVTSFFIEKAPRRAQEYILIITTFFSLVIFAFLVWQSFAYADRLKQHHEGTMTLGIPLYPQVYCLTLGSVLMCLVLITHFLEALRKVVKR